MIKLTNNTMNMTDKLEQYRTTWGKQKFTSSNITYNHIKSQQKKTIYY